MSGVLFLGAIHGVKLDKGVKSNSIISKIVFDNPSGDPKIPGPKGPSAPGTQNRFAGIGDTKPSDPSKGPVGPGPKGSYQG